MPSAICLYTHFNRSDDIVAGQLSRRYKKKYCLLMKDVNPYEVEGYL